MRMVELLVEFGEVDIARVDDSSAGLIEARFSHCSRRTFCADLGRRPWRPGSFRRGDAPITAASLSRSWIVRVDGTLLPSAPRPKLPILVALVVPPSLYRCPRMHRL